MAKITFLFILSAVICGQAYKHRFNMARFGPSSARIVGGQEATPHAYPYQAALIMKLSNSTGFCGGSLISRRFILTAAHCVVGVNSIEVVLGAHNITAEEPTQKRYQAKSFKYHEDYTSDTTVNDVAVIELPEEVELNAYIQIVPLQSNNADFTGKQATVTGWGRYSDLSQKISQILRYMTSRIMDDLLCDILFFGAVQSTNICTEGIQFKSPCNGDSGGPLVVGGKQVGIVSFGLVICRLGWPSVYTRVPSYIDWIKQNTDVVVS